jgi:hypothetical protein
MKITVSFENTAYFLRSPIWHVSRTLRHVRHQYLTAGEFCPVHERETSSWLSLAHFVGKEVGYAIFRRFASLNAKTLLDLQAELVQLEHELNDLEVQNSKYDEKEALQCRVSELKKSIKWPQAMAKVLETREKLEYYSKSFPP